MEDIRYPIGRFAHDASITAAGREACISRIAELPSRLRRAVGGLSPGQIATPYREGGWTIAQVVHHLADSHINSFVRFKLALTEDNPTIKPYKQEIWAGSADASTTDISQSLKLIEGLHARWTVLLRSFSASDFQRTFMHPERGAQTLDHALQMYAWHGDHHLAHITGARERNGWK